METTRAQLENLVRGFLQGNAGGEQKLSDELTVSERTIKDWAEGKNVPHPAIAKSFISRLKKLMRAK